MIRSLGTAQICLLLAASAVTASAIAGAGGAEVVPLERAHAHNDYNHARPLEDALGCGFCSVEVDVFLVDGKLLVAHDRDQCRIDRDLETLYLAPLRERIQANDGSVYKNGPGLTLLIDIKSDAEKTYAALDRLLAKYKDIFTEFRVDEISQRAVTALISGHRPVSMITGQERRFAALDGRPADLKRDPSVSLVPLISTSWGSMFSWRGFGEMPQDERDKLDAFVKQAHEQERRVRFWALPWGPRVWEVVYEAGVDLINADNLTGLRNFLLNKRDE